MGKRPDRDHATSVVPAANLAILPDRDHAKSVNRAAKNRADRATHRDLATNLDAKNHADLAPLPDVGRRESLGTSVAKKATGVQTTTVGLDTGIRADTPKGGTALRDILVEMYQW